MDPGWPHTGSRSGLDTDWPHAGSESGSDPDWPRAGSGLGRDAQQAMLIVPAWGEIFSQSKHPGWRQIQGLTLLQDCSHDLWR